MNMLNGKLGYTLMEMMIVVVVIAILAAAGIPYYKDHIERQKAALGVTNIRMIADSVERYMALRNDTIPESFTLLDAEIDRSKLTHHNTAYNDGSFTYTIVANSRTPHVLGVRNTGEYSLIFSLGDNAELTCSSTDPDICSNKLGL